MKNNTPAFPNEGGAGNLWNDKGMTLRDYFAGQVVVGVMSEYWNSDRMRDPTFEDIALSAYGIADAMMEAREA